MFAYACSALYIEHVGDKASTLFSIGLFLFFMRIFPYTRAQPSGVVGIHIRPSECEVFVVVHNEPIGTNFVGHVLMLRIYFA